MSDLDDKIIVHVLGETDFTSFVYPTHVFDGREKIFGTEAGDRVIQGIGAFLANDNWTEIATQDAGDGSTYQDLMANGLVAAVAGTATLEAARANGANLIAIVVHRAPGGTDAAPVFGARTAGISRTTTTDPAEHAQFTFRQLRHMSPMLLQDLRDGALSPQSRFIDYLEISEDEPDIDLSEEDVGEAPGAPDAGATDAMPVSTFFHEMEVDRTIEPVIVCAADPDLAAALAATDTLTTSLLSGVVPTPHGSAGYWLWKVGVGTPHAFLVEQFLDIHDVTSDYYARLKARDTIRFVLIDRTTQEIARVITLSTEQLGLERFEALAREAAAEEETHDFATACEHVMATLDPAEVFEREMSATTG